MAKCPICMNRKKELKRLQKEFNDNMMYTSAECVKEMGIEFLGLYKLKNCIECTVFEKEGEICEKCMGTGHIILDERYIDNLKECSKCGSVVSTLGTNFVQSRHKHLCVCGWESKEFDNVDNITW